MTVISGQWLDSDGIVVEIECEESPTFRCEEILAEGRRALSAWLLIVVS